MKEYKIKLKLNDNIFIEAIIPCKEQELEGCEETTITFHYNQEYYTLSKHNCIGLDIENLNTALKEALNNRFTLHPSIDKDIGYMTNEYFHDSSKELFIRNNGGKSWIGMNYLIWSPRGIGTWLYNKDSTILLEIAPFYKWHHIDPKRGEDFITYAEFIKNYKPYFILELNRDIAQQWLNKTEELLTIIKQNYERYEKLEQEKMKSNVS